MTNQMTTNQNQGEKIMKIEIDILNSTSQMTTPMEPAKETQPNYTNCLTFKQLEELDCFDDIPHKWLKDKHKDDDMEVEIIDLECERPNWSKTLFNFELSCGLYAEHFNVVLEYNNSGFHALYIMEHLRLCVICNQHIDTRYNDDGHICEDCCKEDDEEEKEEHEPRIYTDDRTGVICEERKDEPYTRVYNDHINRVEDKPTGYFDICDLDLFTNEYPIREFNELKEELEKDGYLEVLVWKEKEESTLPNCYSDIYLSIGENKRITYTHYNTSSPFAMWLCDKEIHDCIHEQDEEDYGDHANRVEEEPIGSFDICDLDEFEEGSYPRSEFNQLKQELEVNEFIEVFIYKEKEEDTLPVGWSVIYLSIGDINKRITYNQYTASSPFGMWLSRQNIHYYADEQDEDIQENVEPSQ